MKDYKRLTERDDSLCIDCADIGSCRKTCIRQARYERLQFLENEIQSGNLISTVQSDTAREILQKLIYNITANNTNDGYLSESIDYSSTIDDIKELAAEYGEAKGISRLTDKEIEFFAKHNARVRGNADPKIAHLTAEIIKLRARLDKAIELPRIIHPNTYEWFVQYQNKYGLIFDEIFYSERAAEARLKEIKEKNNG